MDHLFQLMAPTILELVAAGVAAVFGWGAFEFKRRTGLEIEEKHRAALERAIVSGIMSLIDRDDTTKATDAVEDYVRESVPDAIKALKPTTKVLRAKIVGTLQSKLF